MAQNPLRLREWREQLVEALTSGVRTFRDSNGEEVTYRSVSEINAAIAALDREIASLVGGRKSSIVYLQTSKGV